MQVLRETEHVNYTDSLGEHFNNPPSDSSFVTNFLCATL